MANIKSIGGNPIVVGLDGLTDNAKVTLLTNRPSATLSGSLVTADDASPTTPVETTIYGLSMQDGTPTPSSPVPIVSVGGQPVDADGWTHGGIDGSTGAVVTGNTRIHTNPIAVIGGMTYMLAWDDVSTYGLEVYQYAEDDSYIVTSHSWRASPYAFTVGANAAYVRLLAYNKTTTNIAESEGAIFKARMANRTIPYVPFGSIGLWAQGRNLLDPSIARSGTSQEITLAPDADGWFTISGTSTATSASVVGVWGANDAKIMPPGVYTLLLETEGTPFAGTKVRLQVFGTRADTSSTYITNAGSYTMDYTENGIDRISVMIGNTSSGTTVNGRFRVTLVSGTTAPTEYIPYVGTVTPIDLDGQELRSLPDGTRDELTVDAEGHVTLIQRVGVVTLNGSENWSASSTTANVAYRGISDARVQSYVDNALCDHFAASLEQLADMADPSFKMGKSSDATPSELLYIKSSSVAASVADLKTWLASNPTTVTYPLKEPVTHDLGTVPLVPLVGPDLTAQTVPVAPMALTYERDATIALDRLTAMWANVAPVEGDTASANYAVGSYLMHGGQLCRVTTAIATGEAIAIGTNVTTTTVMAEVIALTQ